MPRRPIVTEDQRQKIQHYHDSLEWSTRKIAPHVGLDHVTVWRVIQEIKKQNVSKQFVSDPLQYDRTQTRELEREIEGYSPALASSFNHGLGSVTPLAITNRAVNAGKQFKDYIEFRQAKFELTNLISEKKLNPIENRFRETLKKQVERLGFDESSDNNIQFGQLNDMATAGLAALKMAGDQKKKLNIAKLVDAAILYRRPDWRKQLEESRRQLRCSRCRKLRSFIKGKDNKTVICVTCGKEESREKARFRIALRKIDPEYVDLVHLAVSSKFFGSGVEPRPLTTTPVAAGGFRNSEVCENVKQPRTPKDVGVKIQDKRFEPQAQSGVRGGETN